MAWKYPPYRWYTGEVMHIEDLNEDLERIVEEASGYLNEHNWALNAFDRDDIADGTQHTVAYAYKEDPDSYRFMWYAARPDPTFPVPDTRLWYAVESIRISITTEDVLLWIMCSFQRCAVYVYQSIIDTHNLYNFAQGFEFVLRVDGAMIWESLQGSGEPENEAVRVTRIGNTDNAQQSHGFGRQTEPMMCEAIVPVAPGVHQIELCVRSLGKDYRVLGAPKFLMGGDVRNREITVIQLHNTPSM